MPLDPFATVAHFDLTFALERLAELPDEPGDWVNPASLSRFDLTEMDWKMLKRFEKKIKPVDFGHVPDADSVWSAFRTPCWIWQGHLHPKGYGRFHLGKNPDTGVGQITAYAHRISFEHFVGFPPRGYIVDHECNVKTCCNPTHLWPQTNQENLRLADERRPWKRRNQYSKE